MEQRIKEQIVKWDKLYQEQSDFYHRAAQWAGLSDAAYWVLYFLCYWEGDVTQSILCKENYFSKQTINSAVTKLSKKGLIKLKNQKGNGNRKSIELTFEGNQFCDKYVRPIIEVEIGSFEALTEKERTMMIALFSKLLKYMEQGVEKICQ